MTLPQLYRSWIALRVALTAIAAGLVVQSAAMGWETRSLVFAAATFALAVVALGTGGGRGAERYLPE